VEYKPRSEEFINKKAFSHYSVARRWGYYSARILFESLEEKYLSLNSAEMLEFPLTKALGRKH
jgi:hypothetical protein